ncbi:MAG: hypothetical protein RL708_542 [Bacteroidota bacterium]|jgi:hypothetical protein
MKKIFLSIIFLFVLNYTVKAQVIDGYTDKQSYSAGETVSFFINGTPNDYNCGLCFDVSSNTDFSLFALDGSSTFIGSHPLNFQSSTNSNAWENGFGYTATFTWTVPSTVKSGYYLLNNVIPVIIKGDKNIGGADIVIVYPTNTDNAYTNSGGKCLYPDCSSLGQQATTVSFHRPVERINYEGANFSDGFLSWIKNTNYKINVIADMDMDDWSEIEHAKLLIVIGHSEYWTRQARLNFDRFVDNGKDAMVLSGNTMWWQVRYSSDKSQMICYKNAGDVNPDTDEANDILLRTTEWTHPILKYSVLGSIGADWGDPNTGKGHGGYGIEGTAQPNTITGAFVCNYSGNANGIPNNGHIILLPNSPLLNGSWEGNTIAPFSVGDILHFPTGEYDGTLIKRDANGNEIFDANGNPILDVAALGFYKAEMIGYDKTKYPSPSVVSAGETNYCPFIAFQKNCYSGKVINVSSNMWCSPWAMGGQQFQDNDNSCSSFLPDTRLTAITQNMIDLLLQQQNIWADPTPPTSFDIKPNVNGAVSYQACVDHAINITPCGLISGYNYKVDRNDKVLSMSIDNNCNTYTALKYNISQNNSNIEQGNIYDTIIQFNVSVFPNPFEEKTELRFYLSDAETNVQIALYNMMGQQVKEIANNQTLTEGIHQYDIARENLPSGIYQLQLKTNNGIINKQVVIQ